MKPGSASPLSRLPWARGPVPWLVTGLLVLLAWLGWQIGRDTPQADPDARPALWRIVKGDRQAYLFGTIHAVPKGERWLSPAIAKAADQSDRLILEVTGLDAERSSRAIFSRLGRSPGLPPLAARLAPQDAGQLATLERRNPSAYRGLAGYESWAAALLVSAEASGKLSLSAEDAGEAVLAHRFTQARKPVRGLETIEGQLGLFDRLPEADQRLLLAQAVREAADAPRLYKDLHTAWTRADLPRLERQFVAPLARSPGLRRVLIDDRNAHWATAIDADLRDHAGTAFIAVGAGHLIGPGSVQARLVPLGWKIQRIQ